MDTQEVYDKIITFAKNFRHNAPLSNIYYIRKYDEDDNLIDEYFGMNHFTHYGMQQYCLNRSSFPQKLYIGYGNNTSFDRNQSSIISPIMDDPATNINTTIDYNYPLYYYEDENHDSSKSYITCMCRFLQVRLNFGVPNRDVRIAEYGIGNSQTELWTHSKVYTITGESIYITKRLNEKLEFDVFMCMSYSKKMIDDAWSQGVFTVITQMQRFMTAYFSSGSGSNLVEKYNMYPAKTFTYRRNDIITERPNTMSRTYGTEDVGTHNAKFVTTIKDFELYDQDSDDQRCFSGFCEYTPGWCVLEEVHLPNAEPVDTKIKAEELNDIYGYSASNLFGTKKESPFTQLHVDHVYMFNVIPDPVTGEYGYTNEVEFINSDTHEYCETSMGINCAIPISMTQNENNVQLYLHMNTHPDDPITSFENISSIGTLYATDAYWDTWTYIPNPQHIPVEHQRDRFWITQSNEVSLKPVRQSPRFSYNPSCGMDDIVGYSQMEHGGSNVFDGYDTFEDDDPNAQYRYCINHGSIYYPELKEYYNIQHLNSSIWHKYYGYGRWLLTFPYGWSNSNNQYILTDVINKESTIITSKFINLNASINSCGYITNNGKGIICIQTYNSTSSNRECIAIDLRNITSIIHDMSQYETYLGNTWCATTVWGTSYIAYIPNGVHEIHIFDFDHPTNPDRVYTIPSDIQSSYKFIYAHSQYVWLTSGGTSGTTYLLNLDTGTWKLCIDQHGNNCALFDTDIATNWQYINFTCVDKFMMMYRNDTPSNWLRDVYYVPIATPMSINNNMANISDSADYFNRTKYFKLRYISTEYDLDGNMTKGTLALMCSCGRYRSGTDQTQGACIKVIDFGEFYYNDSVSNHTTSIMNNICSLVPYGEFYLQGARKIPIEYGLRHKVVGTTTSVTAMNHIKHIADQRWETTITNVLSEEFDGIPRGEHR